MRSGWRRRNLEFGAALRYAGEGCYGKRRWVPMLRGRPWRVAAAAAAAMPGPAAATPAAAAAGRSPGSADW